MGLYRHGGILLVQRIAVGASFVDGYLPVIGHHTTGALTADAGLPEIMLAPPLTVASATEMIGQ
jgi:hypothetical protein